MTHARILAALALVLSAPACPRLERVADDAPGIDAPRIDAPGIDAPGIDAPGIDAPGIDAPGIDAPRDGDPWDVARPDARRADAPLGHDGSTSRDADSPRWCGRGSSCPTGTVCVGSLHLARDVCLPIAEALSPELPILDCPNARVLEPDGVIRYRPLVPPPVTCRSLPGDTWGNVYPVADEGAVCAPGMAPVECGAFMPELCVLRCVPGGDVLRSCGSIEVTCTDSLCLPNWDTCQAHDAGR